MTKPPPQKGPFTYTHTRARTLSLQVSSEASAHVETCRLEAAMSSSYYDVLRVDRNATVDEIKLAFKKRALLVHPDKGGSKEAFHLVYQALEILTDPEARRKYDSGITARKHMAAPGREQTNSGDKKNTTRKRGPAAPKASCPKPQNAKFSRMPRPDSDFEHPAAPAAPQTLSRKAKLLRKIHDLLKQLPRDVRNEVITKEFSQKQRLILEQWMVENSPQAPLESQAVVALATERAQAAMDQAQIGLADKHSCNALPVPATAMPMSHSVAQYSEHKTESLKKKLNAKGTTLQGCVIKCHSRYRASICFDTVCMWSPNVDLTVALDYLVVFTLVVQKMRDPANANDAISFEERLQETLASCAEDHGIDFSDLSIRFGIWQACGFFLGRLILRTPTVRSFEQLRKMRQCLEPFRQYSKHASRRNLLWQYSPTHLQDAWEQLQRAVAYTCEVAGVDNAKFMHKIRQSYKANASVRERHLQTWELEHMATEDQHKHQSRKVRYRLRKKRFPRRKPPSKLCTLKRLKELLVRWELILTRESRLLDRKHSRLLKQQKAQRKKDQEKRRRLEIQSKKRLREEQRLRREAHSKRMRFSGFMDDLRWI